MSDSVCLSSTVKQAGKDFTYLIVVLIGLGVTGDVFDLAQTKAWLWTIMPQGLGLPGASGAQGS